MNDSLYPEKGFNNDELQPEKDKGLEITKARGPELTPEKLHEMGYYTRVGTASIEAARIIK